MMPRKPMKVQRQIDTAAAKAGCVERPTPESKLWKSQHLLLVRKRVWVKEATGWRISRFWSEPSSWARSEQPWRDFWKKIVSTRRWKLR